MSFPRYERYKESGVEWLGEVPEGWEVTKIRRLCEIKKRIVGEIGFDVLSITQQGIKIKDIECNDGQMSMDYSKYQLVEIGDFAMNHMDLLTGYVDISDGIGVTSPDYRVFTIKDKKVCYDRYILYLFQMGYKNRIFYAFGQGSSQLGRWRLPTEQFNELTFPIPPLHEQQTISTFLDRETGKIDALMAEQEVLIALLKEKRQAVISHAVTKGLNPDVPMKNSGIEWLGEVPEGWEVKRFKALVKSIKAGPFGSALTKDMYVSEGYRVYGQEQVIPGDFTVGDYFISPEKYIELQQHQVVPGDILISCVGTFGKIAIVPKDIEPGIINPRLMRVRCAEAVSDEYLAILLRSDVVFEQFAFLSRGGTMDIINIGILSEIFLVVPLIDEQSAIVAFLDSETAKIDTLVGEAQQAIGLLKERRSALISAAVTGKIDVRDKNNNPDECDLEDALTQTRIDLAKASFVKGSAEKHIARLKAML